jgi:hypothetical protein
MFHEQTDNPRGGACGGATRGRLCLVLDARAGLFLIEADRVAGRRQLERRGTRRARFRGARFGWARPRLPSTVALTRTFHLHRPLFPCPRRSIDSRARRAPFPSCQVLRQSTPSRSCQLGRKQMIRRAGNRHTTQACLDSVRLISDAQWLIASESLRKAKSLPMTANGFRRLRPHPATGAITHQPTKTSPTGEIA